MSISLLMEMAVSQDPDRLALVCAERRWTAAEVSALADGGAGLISGFGAQHVVYLGVGGWALPLLMFSAARAATPFTPLNYRLSSDAIAALIARLPDPLVVVDSRYRSELDGFSGPVLDTDDFLSRAADADPIVEFADPDDIAVVLYTSGTTSAPKAVELSHNNLTSYITGSVEFASAQAGEAALICVPPYHIAGVGAALSNLYAGRTMVYLPTFDAAEWLRLVREENVTTATVVPTMLDLIVAALEENPVALPSLRNLAYGGSKAGLPLVRKALRLLPDVGFVNAYGLTETSSTIAVLNPEDHRLAEQSSDPAVARRLASVGRPLPGIEVQIRDERQEPLRPGCVGELFVRGEQVSGRYTGIGSVLDDQGWFATRDLAMLDDAGYLFLNGRIDDTIIRGGENIAPAELEEVLIEHPDVREVVVVGVDDSRWGQAIVAVVVPEKSGAPDPEALRQFARSRLRGSRTPDRIVYRETLPTNATGKVLRREIVASLGDGAANIDGQSQLVEGESP